MNKMSEKDRDCPLSARQRMTMRCENNRNDRELSKELSQLEKEKKIAMRALNDTKKHYVEQKIRISSARNRASPSPEKVSRSPPGKSLTSRSPNLRAHSRGSGSLSPSANSSFDKDISPKSVKTAVKTPGSARSRNDKDVNSNVTNKKTNIPDIIVTDEQSPSENKQKTKIQSGTATNSIPKSNKDLSLPLPEQRCRSSSVGSSSQPSSQLQNRDRTRVSPTVAQDSGDLPPKSQERRGSVSTPYFSHLKDAPRRNSLLVKYTSRRKSSVSMSAIISDISKGISHTELFSDDYTRARVSQKEWEELRKCRYLRIHGEDGKLDFDEIFSRKGK